MPALIRARAGTTAAIACLLLAATMSNSSFAAPDDPPGFAAPDDPPGFTAPDDPPGFTAPGNPLARARAFLKTLDDGSRAEASAAISAPDRVRWSYLPQPRTGLRLGDLDVDQRSAWASFLMEALGRDGVARLDRIRATEPIQNRGGGVHTGPEEFRIRFFGLEAAQTPPAWSWRIEGHHLSIHQTFIGEDVVCITPIFLGSVVRRDADGEPLGVEDRRAAAILEGIPPEARSAAFDPRRLSSDLRTAMKPSGEWAFEGGVPLSRSGPDARRHADAIVDDLLALHPRNVGATLRGAWQETSSEDISFSWCGDVDRSRPHQWRLVSPTLVVEFSHSGHDVQHGHLVLRTPKGEFPDRAVAAWRDAP